MIVTDPYDWARLYESIKEESRKSEEKHVHIYVSAADADSVCALKILEVQISNDAPPFLFPICH